MQQITKILAKDPVYSLTNSPHRQVTEIIIRADKDDLAGFTLPAASPGDGYPLGKVFLEVFTPQRNLLREAASTRSIQTESGQVQFNFSPIRNSHAKEFVLRFIRSPENAPETDSPYWAPQAGFIHMVYDKRNNVVAR